MLPAHFYAESRVLIVAGKGGVGKSTATATLARSASRAGLRTLRFADGPDEVHRMQLARRELGRYADDGGR